jgi:site-specific recombinase XerD
MSNRIDRVNVRERLPLRRDPYWLRVSKGRYVGFRLMPSKDNPKRASGAGTWLARAYDGSRYCYETLGDFVTLAENERYDAAKKAAEAWFQHVDSGGSTEPHTVKAACEAYLARLRGEKGDQAAANADGFFRRLVYGQPIARVLLSKLTKQHCNAWRAWVLEQYKGAKSSFNRSITPLRAGLNLAHEEGKVAGDHAWLKALKPLKGGSNRRQLYLNSEARQRLIEHASEAAQALVKAMNLQPVRPGDIPSARVQDLDLENRTLRLAGKGNERIIPLGAAALAHFKVCARGKLPTAWLVARPDGSQWKKEAWRDEIKAAAKAAKLPAATVANTLRHSTITDLVTGGLDLFHVARVAGTSVVMIEKHYGQLQREHVRSALEKLAVA